MTPPTRPQYPGWALDDGSRMMRGSNSACGKCGHGMHWRSCDTLVTRPGGMGVCLCRNDESLDPDPLTVSPEALDAYPRMVVVPADPTPHRLAWFGLGVCVGVVLLALLILGRVAIDGVGT